MYHITSLQWILRTFHGFSILLRKSQNHHQAYRTLNFLAACSLTDHFSSHTPTLFTLFWPHWHPCCFLAPQASSTSRPLCLSMLSAWNTVFSSDFHMAHSATSFELLLHCSLLTRTSLLYFSLW